MSLRLYQIIPGVPLSPGKRVTETISQRLQKADAPTVTESADLFIKHNTSNIAHIIVIYLQETGNWQEVLSFSHSFDSEWNLCQLDLELRLPLHRGDYTYSYRTFSFLLDSYPEPNSTYCAHTQTHIHKYSRTPVLLSPLGM